MLSVTDIRCEHETAPISVGVERPRFSWRLESDVRDTVQTSYRVQVSSDPAFASPEWDSGTVSSDRSQFVRYAGRKLRPRTRYFIRVRAAAASGGVPAESPWSEASWFETALLGEPWTAPFIGGSVPESGKYPRPTYLRTEFTLSGEIGPARVYATALGLYELWINGRRVGEDLLTPGWTDYRERLAYQTYDVGSYLKPGKNAIGAILAEGWYAGDLTWMNLRNLYGERTALSLSLRVQDGRGRTRTIEADGTWKSGVGPIRYSELYHGEVYDARLEEPLWALPGFDSSSWTPAVRVPFDASVVVPQDGPPVRRRKRFPALELIATPKGERVLDFGQNLSGWVSFSVRGKRGDRVVLRHAETLDAAGNFYDANMRTARNLVEYTLKGEGEERYEPRFSFQGFRYVRIDEYPGKPEIDDFAAWAIHSDMEDALEFECSNELLNKLHRNIEWGWRGNAVDVPTDCPQRDERLGWTGDAQVFVGTAAYLMGVGPFFRKWLRDLRASQLPDGGVPFVIPDILTPVIHREPKIKESHSSTGWGDAATIVPWTVYERTGDDGLLAEQYPSMVAWVEYIRSRAEGGLIWNTGFHFGDWVALDAKEGSYFGATPNDLTATAFYFRSAELVALAAGALGKKKEAASYRKLAEAIREAFRAEFFTPSGRLAARTQTGYILALTFGLVPEGHRERAVDELAALLTENGGHLTTGFLGTPYFCRALSGNGRLDLAYDLLLKEDYPSWLYQVAKGATTVWEHWDGLKPDGTMWSPEMNSFNHYAYGAVGQWMYETIAGLSPLEPGFRVFSIAPQPGGGIDRCRIAHRGPYGWIRAEWRISAGVFSLELTVPPGTRALVTLPGEGAAGAKSVGSGAWSFTASAPAGAAPTA